MLPDAELQRVIGLEQRLLEPAVRAAGADVAALVHPDFVEFGASGRRWDRAGVVAALAEAPEVAGEATDFHAHALAGDVVLVTYRMTGVRPSLRSSIWVDDAGHGWRLRFHQGTPAT